MTAERLILNVASCKNMSVLKVESMRKLRKDNTIKCAKARQFSILKYAKFELCQNVLDNTIKYGKVHESVQKGREYAKIRDSL
jgi:hypothetical protein